MDIERIETKAIIIGAGPAGSGASFFLSKYEIPHIVIEKETFPRDKVCGDACSGKTALVINRANPDWLKEILEAPTDYLPSWGITFIAPNGKALDVPFIANRKPEAKSPGFTVKRLKFDNFLFQKMQSPYCTIYQNSSVKKITREKGKITVFAETASKNYEVSAPVTIGADGDKSIVRKQFEGENLNPKSYAIGVRAYYEGVSGLHKENFIELHFLKELLPGYLWIFPMPNGQVNVGLGIMSEIVRKKKINLREMLHKSIGNNPAIAKRFTNAKMIGNVQGWGLPLAIDVHALSGDNYILTGDAASLIDPFSGEGIGNALYSGMLAAEAIKTAYQEQNFTSSFFKSAYDEVIYKRLGDEFRVSIAMQKLSKYPWLFNLVVNKAHKSPSLRNTISCMFTDMDLRSKLSKPSFYLDILFNR